MKKLLFVILSFSIIASLFSGCIGLNYLTEDIFNNNMLAPNPTKSYVTTPKPTSEITPEPTPAPTPEPTEKPSTELSYAQAKEVAKKYWGITKDAEVLEDGTNIAIFGFEDDYVVSGEIKYYHFSLKWLVVDEDGSPSHYSTVDSVYVNTKTGTCTYTP